jgi:hypothetical protein
MQDTLYLASSFLLLLASCSLIFAIFLFKNCNIPILGLHKIRPSYTRSLKPSKRTQSTSKHDISSPFSIFVSWIRIQPTNIRIRNNCKTLKHTSGSTRMRYLVLGITHLSLF